jgi:hypothetical protein
VSLPFCRYLLWTMRLDLIVGFIGMSMVVLLKSELLGTIQLARGPMASEPLVLAMTLVGMLVGLRVFHDPVGVAVWLNSRGITRRICFQTRLLTGLLVLALMVLWPAVLMATGIRQAVQLSFESPWFPMVRWYELTVIPQMALYAFVPFSIVTLLLMASRTEDSLFPGVWTIASGISGLIISWCCLPFAQQSSPLMLLVAVIMPLGCLAVAVVLAVISEQHVS